MTHNLRDQLLGLGFKPVPKPERASERKPESASGQPRRAEHRGGGVRAAGKPNPNARGDQPSRPGSRPDARSPSSPNLAAQPRSHGQPGRATAGQLPRRGGAGKPRTQDDIDLGKAYAIRAQREKDERIAAEQARQEEARLRREARATLSELVKGHGLNADDAEIARHFPYGGKIKRIHVTPAQLKQLNAGELGVLQVDGRYMLVAADLLDRAAEIFPPAVALKVDPNAPVADDPYADPQYQVPDDLVW